MLRFNPDQFQALSESARGKFELDAWRHLEEHFPDRLTVLGPERSRELLHFALSEAEKFGFYLRPEVLKYINLVFEFGPVFPSDPRFQWASRILTGPGSDRMDRVYAAALGRTR